MAEKNKRVKKKTAGQIIEEHLDGKTPDRATPAELTEEALVKDFESHMTSWIREAKQTFDHDFFIILNLKLERSLDNAPHIIPEARQTCPDPFFDQSVWHYHRKEERLEFLWTIPDFATVKLFKDDPLNCPAEQMQLRQFVLDYTDGTLQQQAYSINESLIRSTNGNGRKRSLSSGTA